MLYLNPKSPNIFIAQQNHSRWVSCFINKKIGGNVCSDVHCAICKSRIKVVNDLNGRIKSFLAIATNLNKLINGNPFELEQINLDFWLHLYPTRPYATIEPFIKKLHPKTLGKRDKNWKRKYKVIQAIIAQIEKVVSYTWLTNVDTKPYNAYDLSKILDRYTCTYCNRLYTSTVITSARKLVTRPTLDHWYPKSEFPLLGVSFFNLVPSCYSCNSSVKGAVKLSLARHIHPYLDSSQTSDFYFDYAYTALDGYKISVYDTASGTINASKAKNTLKEMFMDEVYNSNISELRDLLIIKKNYSKSYINIMQSLLKVKLGPSEVYRILFGTMYDIHNYHKRPLSKFKFDILKKLGMLDDMP